jgi:hypothetical protein
MVTRMPGSLGAPRQVRRRAGTNAGVTDEFLAACLNDRFDVILALGSGYLPNPDEFAGRLFGLCAPGGCVIGSSSARALVEPRPEAGSARARGGKRGSLLRGHRR